MGKLKTLVSALVVAAVLLVCTDYVAFAATGKSLLLGKLNHAAAVTTIDRTTNGPALKLTTNNGASAPIVTNGHGRVANLNADTVDGKHASAFAPKARAPIAAGHVQANGTLGGDFGVSAVSWDAPNHRYLITLTGQSAVVDDFPTAVSPTCYGLDVAVGSIGGSLTVEFVNAAEDHVQCEFGFIVVKL